MTVMGGGGSSGWLEEPGRVKRFWRAREYELRAGPPPGPREMTIELRDCELAGTGTCRLVFAILSGGPSLLTVEDEQNEWGRWSFRGRVVEIHVDIPRERSWGERTQAALTRFAATGLPDDAPDPAPLTREGIARGLAAFQGLADAGAQVSAAAIYDLARQRGLEPGQPARGWLTRPDDVTPSELEILWFQVRGRATTGGVARVIDAEVVAVGANGDGWSFRLAERPGGPAHSVLTLEWHHGLERIVGVMEQVRVIPRYRLAAEIEERRSGRAVAAAPVPWPAERETAPRRAPSRRAAGERKIRLDDEEESASTGPG